jgi:hypothetical protein
MSDVLGVACRAVRADYTTPDRPDDWALRGLGIDNHPDYPYRVELRDLPLDFRREGDWYHTIIQTPAGKIETHMIHTAEMQREGISLPFVKKFAMGSIDDFEKIAQVFDHLEVVSTPDAYAAFQKRIGERGLAVASGCVGVSPMHWIFHELVSQEQFFYLYADERAALQRLAERMEPFFHRVLNAVIASSAEVVFWSGNYDQDLTWPSFFKAEIAPWLKWAADRVHEAGKFLLTHTDGENEKLLPLYPGCGFDVAESVCPTPMTRCSLAEIRVGMGPKVTVWGGIPSVALLEDSMDDRTFETYLDHLFAELGMGERLIFGVSDNVPPDAKLSRLEQIRKRVESFGPVPRCVVETVKDRFPR